MDILTARTKKMIAFVATLSVLCMLNITANAQTTTGSTTASTGAAGSTAAAGTAGGTGSAGGSGIGGSASLYLQEIAQYTNGILVAVNNVPAYLLSLAMLAVQWVSPDTSDTTAALQATLSTYTNQMLASQTLQVSTSTNITNDMFGSTVTTTTVPYANDLDFNTLLGSPFFSPDPRAQNGGAAINSAYNFIENAAGIYLPHVVPGPTWGGAKNDQLRYANYYRTVNAVQSYDAFVLAQLYSDINSKIPASQATLLSQASNSNWFAEVASEQIGIVLRQILMYSSQTFVLLSQLLQTEKQMLATQAMTNSLLIATGGSSEAIMMQRAIIKTS